MKLSKSALIMVKPPSRIISQHKSPSRAEFESLLDSAVERGYLLYSAELVKKNGKFFAVQPWVLVEESLVDGEEPEEPESDVEVIALIDGVFKCPWCNKEAKSTSGMTLHIKNKHEDKIEKYSYS